MKRKTKSKKTKAQHEALFKQALQAFWLRVAFEMKGRLHPEQKRTARAVRARKTSASPEARSTL